MRPSGPSRWLTPWQSLQPQLPPSQGAAHHDASNSSRGHDNPKTRGVPASPTQWERCSLEARFVCTPHGHVSAYISSRVGVTLRIDRPRSCVAYCSSGGNDWISRLSVFGFRLNSLIIAGYHSGPCFTGGICPGRRVQERGERGPRFLLSGFFVEFFCVDRALSNGL